MNEPNRLPTTKPSMGGTHAPRGHDLRTLYDEASHKLEPLFAESKEQSFSTLMYLALNRLHNTYPQLSHDELEALFMGLVNRRNSRVQRAHH